jgi:flagellin FlaB
MGGYKTRKPDKGIMGIGAMIILIAVLLISAIAAIIIINVGGRLQQRSLNTGKQAEKGTINGVEVVSIMGTDGSAGRDIEHFEVIIKLQPGSDVLNLNNTAVFIHSPGRSQTLVYNESAGDTANEAATTSDFTVEWLTQSDLYQEGYLSRGEIIKLRFNYFDNSPGDTTGGIGPEQDMELKIVPRTGAVTIISFRTPKHINEQREPLWPKETQI